MKILTYLIVLFALITFFSEHLFTQGNTWMSGLAMPTRRVAPAAAEISAKLFVVGGFTDSAGAYSVIEVYDPLTNSWATGNPMPTARGRLAVGVIDSILYAVGGFGDQTAVEAYNHSTNMWTTKAPVNQGRLGAAAGVMGGKLYVVGGTSFDSLQTVEEYDPNANTWTFKTRMPTPRFLLAATVIGSKLYAVGGTNSLTGGSALSVLEVYNPATDTWETKASMPTPRSDLAAAVIDGKMYVVGGFGVGVVLEVYDPVLDAWSILAPMPTARGDLAAGVLNGKLYAVGGTSAPGATPLSTVEVYTPGGLTSVDERNTNRLPLAPTLRQNYPNPFNPTTTIEYVLLETGFVSLKIHNLFGQEIATLVNSVKSAGYHKTDWNATGFPSGIYYYRIQARDFVETRTLILLR